MTNKLSTITASKILIGIFYFIFSVRTWKTIGVIAFCASLITSYGLLKEKYNWKCAQGGYLIRKDTCDLLANSEYLESENARLNRILEESTISLNQ